MISKNKVRRYALQNSTQDEDIIEVEEIPYKKPARNKALYNRIEIIENTEDTSPNKRRLKNKKNEMDLIEIDIPSKKKFYSQTSRPKKSNNILLQNDNDNKKREKLSFQSISKVYKGEKPILNRNKKFSRITLDENDDEDIKLNEINESSASINIYKNKRKINDHKKEEITIVNEKKYLKEEKENIRNVELLSEESENEIKCPYKSNKKSNYPIEINIEDNKSLETNNFIGKKRTQDKKSRKSMTPHKKVIIPSSINKKSLIQKSKSPSQITEVSKSPIKSLSKRNSTIIDIAEVNKKKDFSNPEIEILSKLLDEYGFEKVLDSLCQIKLSKNSKLDSCLQGLTNSCDNNKINYLLFKMLFSYFDKKMKAQDEVIKERIRPSSITKSISKSSIVKSNKNEIPTKKNYISETLNITSQQQSQDKQIEESNPIYIEEEEEKKIKKIDKVNSGKKAKNKKVASQKNMNEEEKKPVKKMVSIGSHYNKSEDGKVFKYQVANLDGKGNAIFKCYDDNCSGMGTYNLRANKFSLIKEHNLKYEEHDYITEIDKIDDDICKKLMKKNKSDAQVFKENDERVIKFY